MVYELFTHSISPFTEMYMTLVHVNVKTLVQPIVSFVRKIRWAWLPTHRQTVCNMLHVFTSVILQLYRYTPQILKELGEGSDVCGWSLIIG